MIGEMIVAGDTKRIGAKELQRSADMIIGALIVLVGGIQKMTVRKRGTKVLITDLGQITIIQQLLLQPRRIQTM